MFTDSTMNSNNLNQFNNADNMDNNESDSDDSYDSVEQKTYKGIFYADAMDMEEAIKKDMNKIKIMNNVYYDNSLDTEEHVEKEEKLNVIDISEYNLGDGKMDYIKDESVKYMLTNAWEAITKTNTWDFVEKDIFSFMLSMDDRINLISNKMEELGYNGHSGCSFGWTMRQMQYLAQKGEDEFKNIFNT